MALKSKILEMFSDAELQAELDRRQSDEHVEVGEDDYMPRVQGVTFRCECGCNVFRKATHDEAVYVCNACKLRYRGE